MSSDRNKLSYPILSGKGKGLDCFLVKDLGIDQTRASAIGILAASSKDRGGETVNIAGIKTDKHKINPQISWLHFMDWKHADCNMPIGVAEDPSGNYTVKLLPDEGIVTCETYFNQKTQLSAQICALVMCRDIRAMSIGYKELETERQYEEDRWVGNYLKSLELFEGAWVHLPMNGDCARSIMAKTIDGHPLHPSIVQSLIPYASPTPVWANGFTPPEVKTMPEPKPTPAPAVTPPAKTKADDKPEDKPDEEKLGSKALRAMHKAAKAYGKACMKACKGLDDDHEASVMGKANADAADDHAEEAKSLHGKCYKDAEPITDDEGEEGEPKGKDDDEGGDEEKALQARLRKAEQTLKHQLRLQKPDAA